MNLKYLLICLLTLILLSSNVSATDWYIGNPTGLGYTNYATDQFVIPNNNASTGNIGTYNLQFGSAFSSSSLFTNCDRCLYGFINPIDNYRWGTDEMGNVFYTTQLSPVDYSAGFYTAGITGTCYSAGGNCNNLHQAAIVTGSTRNMKMTFDSEGNVYVMDGVVVKKLIKSLGFTAQTFYTLTTGIDYATPDCQAGGVNTVHALGLIANSTNGIHMLIGTECNNAGNGASTGSISRIVLTTDGTLATSTLNIVTSSDGSAPRDTGFYHGGMVLDATNPVQNFTYAYTTQDSAGILNTFIKHKSTAGTVDVGGGSLGTDNLTDIGYNNFQIYATFPSTNTVSSFVTNFEGFGFSQVPTNEEGITGTFDWKNGYGTTVTSITPGMALKYRWTIDSTADQDLNYTYFSGWGTDTQTEPNELRDLTDLTGLTNTPVFNTNSNDLAGTSIYGYLLARRNNDSSWSLLATPQILTISPASVGYDSITLDKAYYNLTGDTISATLTYSQGYPYIYKWVICTRVDCEDGVAFAPISLIAQPLSSSTTTDGLQEGNYYAVLMRHLPVIQSLTNDIVAYQRFTVRAPIIGVSWDKPSYNLLPKSQATTCRDSTPSFFGWNNISGYAGLQRGWFSCETVPANSANNNSIMRGSLSATYNGTFYLNNSLGNIWNGSLSNGSGALIYVLTNSSPTETWSLVGVNDSDSVTYTANADVNPESLASYTISVSPKVAYNGQTLTLTFTKPIWIKEDFVRIVDASGTTLISFDPSATSGQYYIDPSITYSYGTWTAYWGLGSMNSQYSKDSTSATFTVINAGKPHENASLTPYGEQPSANSAIQSMTNNAFAFLAMPAFWGLLIWGLIVYGVNSEIKQGNNNVTIYVAFVLANIEAAIGLWAPFTIYIIVIVWLIAAILFILSGIGRKATIGE